MILILRQRPADIELIESHLVPRLRVGEIARHRHQRPLAHRVRHQILLTAPGQNGADIQHRPLALLERWQQRADQQQRRTRVYPNDVIEKFRVRLLNFIARHQPRIVHQPINAPVHRQRILGQLLRIGRIPEVALTKGGVIRAQFLDQSRAALSIASM